MASASASVAESLDAQRALTDTNSYRLVTLAGGLRVLLVHDAPKRGCAAASKAVFSVAVGGGAGSAADPDAAQGLGEWLDGGQGHGSAPARAVRARTQLL